MVDINDEIVFNEKNFSIEMLVHSCEYKNSKLILLQSKVKDYLKNMKRNAQKMAVRKKLNEQFGMKIGKNYHFIKVLRRIDDPTTLIVKSDRATNVLKIGMKKLGLKENMNLEEFRSSIKKCIAKILKYDAKRHLIKFNLEERIQSHN